MNKLMITLVASLILTVAGTAMAQEDYTGERGKGGMREHRGMQNSPIADQWMRAIRLLDLSVEQEENIKAITKGLKESIRPIMHETMEGHKAMQELIKADVYDQEAVTLIAENEGRLATERILITSRAMSDIFSQLTNEQRIALEEMKVTRKGKRGEKRPSKPVEG